MKFLHTADLHLGKQVCGFSMIEDQRHILSQILDIACTHGARAIVAAGDLYDKTTPSAEAVALLDSFLTEASARGLAVVAVPGNHDSAERVAYASSMLAQLGVHIPPPFNGELARVALTDEHGPVNFWLMPFLKPAHVRPHFPNTSIEQGYTAALSAVIDSARIDKSERNVLVAHQFVTASGHAPERSDSEVNVGGLDNVDASTFDAFDYVALGHIHRAQRMGRDEVRYAGSPLKYSFSEAAHNKSVVLVDTGDAPGKATFELAPLTPAHDMREVRGPLERLISADVVAAASPDDYLHVVLTDEVPAIDALARLRAVYPNVMALDYDNASTRHAGALEHSTDDLEGLNAEELFARFFREQHGKDLTDEQARLVAGALREARNEEGGAL